MGSGVSLGAGVAAGTGVAPSGRRSKRTALQAGGAPVSGVEGGFALASEGGAVSFRGPKRNARVAQW